MHNTIGPNIFELPRPGQPDDRLKGRLFNRAAALGMEELHFKIDPDSGLQAIVAIHNTRRGPALGGTRCLAYANEDDAIQDAMRLAQGMSYKSAFAGLPFGGGKGVLIRPHEITDPNRYFESYGEFIDSLHGRFITAVDVGTTVANMDIIVRKTKHVLSTSADHGDPSLHTAKGVLAGILAAVKVRLNRDDLEDIQVAIQGVGKVGYFLAGLLHQQGAKLAVSDVDVEAVQRCIEAFGANPVDPEKIIEVDCDVLAPCALGGTINSETLNRIKATIICGAANNQLGADFHGDLAHQKNIFYVPDYVVNAGGLIHVIYGASPEAEARISAIYQSVANIYERSQTTGEPSHRVANRIAEKLLSESNQIAAHM